MKNLQVRKIVSNFLKCFCSKEFSIKFPSVNWSGTKLCHFISIKLVVMQNPDPDKLNGVLLLQGNIWQQVLSFHFVLEILNTVPFTVTVSLL